MFAAAGERGLLVKLPPETRKQLLDSGHAQAAETAPGVAFGEWLTLPPASVEDREAALALVRQSFDYVQSTRRPVTPPREPRHFRKRQY
jgi:hypothetical protein